MFRRKRRKRRGYVRPSRAKPKTGWTLREVSGLVGIPVRTLRLYLQQKVLPRPAFKGSATRYERLHLLSLLSIRRLRATERLSPSTLRKRLEGLSPTKLEAFATQDLPPGPLADALGIAPPQAPVTSPLSALGIAHGGGNSLTQFPRWARIELALGLELHVRNDASASVIDLARRLREYCSTSYVDDAG